MTAPTAEEFALRFPELAGHPAAVIEQALATAGLECSEVAFGEAHGIAVGFLAASIITDRVREMGATLGGGSGTPRRPDETHNFYRAQYEAIFRGRPMHGGITLGAP